MARKKSSFRALLSARRLRWSVVRFLASLSPALGRWLNFPLRASSAAECADRVLENRDEPVELPHSVQEARDILAPAAGNDTGDTSGTAAGEGIMRYRAALISDCAILGHTLTLVRQNSMELVNFDGSPGNWNFAKPALLRPMPAGPGQHIVLQGAGHFFHLFANGVLPLIRYIDMHRPEGPLTLVCPAQAPGFQREVISALSNAYPWLRIFDLKANEKITGVEALWIFNLCSNYEWMPVTRALADRLRGLLEECWRSQTGAALPPVPEPAARKLYLDRSDAKLRRLNDETQVRAVLEKHGYESFAAHAGNFREQVRAFSGADEIVAVHGAGLTNLLFCRPGTRVVEIFPENFVKSTYFWLARQLDLDYRYVIGGPGDYDQTFEVGAQKLEALLT